VASRAAAKIGPGQVDTRSWRNLERLRWYPAPRPLGTANRCLVNHADFHADGVCTTAAQGPLDQAHRESGQAQHARLPL